MAEAFATIARRLADLSKVIGHRGTTACFCQRPTLRRFPYYVCFLVQPDDYMKDVMAMWVVNHLVVI